MADKAYSAVSGSMTKIRAEQIKAEDGSLITLAGELAAIKGQIQDIIGDAAGSYKEQVPAAVQLLDLADHLDAEHATDLQVLQNLVASGSVKIDGDKAASVGALYLVGASKEIAETEDVVFADGKLAIDGNLEAVNADFSGTLDVTGAAVLAGTLEVVGAVAMNSTLTVTGSAVLESTLNVQGAADFDSTANFDGVVDMKAALKVTGSVSMDSTLYVKGAAELDSTLTVAGAVDFDSSFEVAGVTDLKGALSVTGSASMASTLAVAGAVDFASTLDVVGAISGSAAIYGASLDVDGRVDAATGVFTGNVQMAELTASNGQFSGNVVVGGNFTVNGTTTTVNSTTLQVDDKNIELGTVDSPTDITADGGGITLKGDTDHTIIWRDTQDAWEFSEHLVPGGVGTKDLGLTGDRWQNLWLAGNADIDGNADVAGTLDVAGATDLKGALEVTGSAALESTLAVKGVASFSSAITGSAGLEISGAPASFLAGARASEIRITGDVAQRLYIVNSDGTIKDEQNLIYTGAQLNVTGVISGSGQVRGASFQAAGLGDVGSLVVQGESQLKGIVRLEPSAEVSGSIVPLNPNMFNLGSAGKRYGFAYIGQANITGSAAVDMIRGSEQKIEKNGAGDLLIKQNVASAYMKFDDTFRGATELSSGLAGIKLANSGEWSTFASAYAGVDSLLGAFNRIAAGGGAEKGYYEHTTSTVSADTAIDISAAPGMSDMSFAGLTKDNSMVFFNGQLLRSGSVAQLTSSPVAADYSFDGGASAVKFAFAVEQGDQLVVQKL